MKNLAASLITGAALLFSVVSLESCAKHESYTATATDSAQTVSTQTTGNAVDHVASDPELLRQALILADSKGTLQTALTEAAQDSIIGIKMRSALILGNSAKAKTTPPATTPQTPEKKSSTKTHTSSGTTSSNNGDVLDKANSGLDKANQTVTKSGEVINKANDINRKVGDILNGKR